MQAISGNGPFLYSGTLTTPPKDETLTTAPRDETLTTAPRDETLTTPPKDDNNIIPDQIVNQLLQFEKTLNRIKSKRKVSDQFNSIFKTDLNKDNYKVVLERAHKEGDKILKNECQEWILKNILIDKENCLGLFSLACQTNAKDLKNATKKFVLSDDKNDIIQFMAIDQDNYVLFFEFACHNEKKELKQKCENWIVEGERITLENFRELYRLSTKYQAKILRDAALNFILDQKILKAGTNREAIADFLINGTELKIDESNYQEMLRIGYQLPSSRLKVKAEEWILKSIEISWKKVRTLTILACRYDCKLLQTDLMNFMKIDSKSFISLLNYFIREKTKEKNSPEAIKGFLFKKQNASESEDGKSEDLERPVESKQNLFKSLPMRENILEAFGVKTQDTVFVGFDV